MKKIYSPTLHVLQTLARPRTVKVKNQGDRHSILITTTDILRGSWSLIIKKQSSIN